MAEDIIIRYVSLPHTVRGMTIQDEEGNYNIYLNSRLSHEAHIATLQHEIKHIKNNDFASPSHISELEKK